MSVVQVNKPALCPGNEKLTVGTVAASIGNGVRTREALDQIPGRRFENGYSRLGRDGNLVGTQRGEVHSLHRAG